MVGKIVDCLMLGIIIYILSKGYKKYYIIRRNEVIAFSIELA